MPANFLACALHTQTIDFEVIDEPKGPFVLFMAVVCMMECITENNKVELLTFDELI